MDLNGITDRDGNQIGITITYTGSDTEDYTVINVYCNHNELLKWDSTYMEHTDKHGHHYYEMTMNSQSGCAKITTD